MISAYELSETFHPMAFFLSAFVSAFALADLQRIRAPKLMLLLVPIVVFWVPTVALPLYSIFRLYGKPTFAQTKAFHRGWWRALPLLYAMALSIAGIMLQRMDARAFDAHLARASAARLHNDHRRALESYRAALALREDAHTRKLLADELLTLGQIEEAVVEFRLARDGGEPDDSIAFRLASALEALGRKEEALAEYRRFAQSARCRADEEDPVCLAARHKATDSKN
ncbi:MAG: hypothetical protein C4334_06470 [Pyrinomonas sp.]|uniref:hypothetical protein n=1 Tax=Pyrinomonas sp. TaxID=2080306 RepID=UPI0033180145